MPEYLELPLLLVTLALLPYAIVVVGLTLLGLYDRWFQRYMARRRRETAEECLRRLREEAGDA